MNSIAIRYRESQNLFLIYPSEHINLQENAKPVVQEMLDKLNSIKIKKRLSTWIFMGSLAVIILVAGLFLAFYNLYTLAVAGFGLVLLVISIVMFRLKLKAIRKGISAICVEYQQKLAPFYDIREQSQILMRASRTVAQPELISLIPVQANQPQETPLNLPFEISNEPIPLFLYNPKKKEEGNVMIASDVEILTQPITPFHEVKSPHVKNKRTSMPDIITNFQEGQDKRPQETEQPGGPDENNPVVEVHTLPPTPQNANQPQNIRLVMDSVYVIPGRRLP